MLIGDDARILQVLINLTANALKFTRQGFVRVSAAAKEQADREVTLRFEVRDTGIGITPENAGRIFDRFTQANPSIHRQYGGSGLGTTICKHLVELMGGAIGFDSQPENGTTFWFTVPLSRQPAEAYEDGVGASIRDSRLCLVSRHPGTGDWLENTARSNNFKSRLSSPSRRRSRQSDRRGVGGPASWSSTAKTVSTGAEFPTRSDEQAGDCRACSSILTSMRSMHSTRATRAF
jgi:hypothetical protein